MWAFLDFAVLIVAVLFAILGAKNGLIVAVCRTVALAGGFFVSFLFYRDLQAHFTALVPGAPGTGAALTAFLAIFLAVSFAVIGLGNLLRKLIKAVTLGWLDRALGLTLGLLKAAVIAWVVCLSLSSIPIQKTQDELTQASIVYRAFKALPDVLSLEGMEGAREAIRGKRPEIERDIIIPAEVQKDTV